ncbi:MAG TPA: tyrosine-type recombinase/integrase [Cytophagaceae bacterium]|jgi:integrase/recombinase XerC
MEAFFKYIQYQKRYSPHTLISYKTDLLQFHEFLTTTYSIDNAEEATYPIIRSWIMELAEKELGSKTINRKIASVRAFYKFLQRENRIAENPTLRIIAPKIRKKLPQFVVENEMEVLLDRIPFTEDFAGLRDKLVLDILYSSGIRLAELINLKESDINNYSQTISVLGKGSKQRVIPINKNLLHSIDNYMRVKKSVTDPGNFNQYLIVTDKGDKAYPIFIYRLVKRYLNYVVSPDQKSPHILRHSFATHLLNNGADLNAIKTLLGHSSLAATQVYTHNSIEKLKSIFDQAHPKS